MKTESLVPTVLQSHLQATEMEEPDLAAAASGEDDWQSLMTDRITETEKHLSLENDNQPKKGKVKEILGKITD